ncbi:MAG: sensor histidine kinase [Romboutsia sp.]|uniref:sensor histidine kinase n=1 Tax=Romboutsia sp. TaxID=1965302 RepID=UPI003F3D673E
MYKSNEKYKRTINKQNRLATLAVIIISAIIAFTYIGSMLLILKHDTLDSYTIEKFIRSFSVVLACLAVASCILCYMSNNKEEVFIISLMYVVFTIDIAFGNVDGMSLTSDIIEGSTYITVATSLIRIAILMILILPFVKTRKYIIDNKLMSIGIVVLLTLVMSCLKFYNIMFLNLDNRDVFIIYNIFLLIVYVTFATRFMIRSFKQREYIYSVISASIYFFGIKAAFAIVGSLTPMYNIKLLSLSTTYMGFIIFIGGLLAELAMSINRNKRLKNEIAIFYNLVDESKDSCILILDESENVRYANKTLELYVKNVFDIDICNIEHVFNKYRDEIDEKIIEEIRNNVRTEGSWSGCLEIEEGSITLDCFMQRIYTHEQKAYTVFIFKDISQKLRNKKRLIEYEKMKNHEKIKNEFFANISHELRTPLNIFYSTIQLLDMKSEDESEEFKGVYNRHKQCLKTNCQRMLRLINNIVDITKIDVGFTTPKFVNCDIVALIEDITLSVINYANPKNINIIFDTEMEEHKIKCDPGMIERAMLNLLSNAIKFTNDKGNILVSMYYDKAWVHIRVKDDGIGIPVEMQGIIFDRFVQGDKSLTRLNEGSGIGLSIVKSIVELNQGEIYLESDEENGTEFEILLPNRVLLDDKLDDEDMIYEIDIQKIELELSDIYKLYE